eukprot:COSAG02_NODE_40925_length_400_cov_0.518272_1_plen_31_part_01
MSLHKTIAVYSNGQIAQVESLCKDVSVSFAV